MVSTPTSSRSTLGLSRRRRNLLGSLLCALTLLTPGCAAFTGLLTGAVTGAVDAPAQIYRYNRGTMDNHPEYWVFNLFVFVPVGIMAGPLAGFAKGLGLDVQFWILNTVNYEDAFTTYRRPSVWRPYTIHW